MLYVIANGDLPNYMAASQWGQADKFNWTADLFFALVSSDKLGLEELRLQRFRTCDCPNYADRFTVRELSVAERMEYLRVYHFYATGKALAGEPPVVGRSGHPDNKWEL